MISKELYDFVSEFSKKQIKKHLVHRQLNKDTTLDEIGIDDLDLDVMLEEFVEKFNVDYSRFNGKRYYGIGIPLVDNNVPIIRKVIGKRKWLPLSEEEREPFTLGNLESAIKTGVLE